MSRQTVPHGRYADQPIDAVPKHQQQWMVAMNTSVADKIAALLERTSNLKRASDIGRPVKFNGEGERHANRIAAADRAQEAGKPSCLF